MPTPIRVATRRRTTVQQKRNNCEKLSKKFGGMKYLPNFADANRETYAAV